MNANRNHNSTPERLKRLHNLWQDWLGQLTFIVLAIGALLYWRQWAAIIIAILFIGMFHRRILSIFTEGFACLNDFFLGTPVNGDVNARSGGLVQGVANVTRSLWGWVRKPFQQREPRAIPPPYPRTQGLEVGEGHKAASLRRLADAIDNQIPPNPPFPKEGKRGLGDFRGQKAESLRRKADLAAEKYQKKQEKLRQKAMEDSAKSPLAWTHLIGAVILTALMVVFIAGELVINLQTLLGITDVPMPKILAESPLFQSFEMMTAAVLVCAGILFGIYILDLLGFIPLIPVHLLSLSVQRIMLIIVIGCGVGTIVVGGALATYRCVSLQGGVDIMEEPMTGDVTDRFGAVSVGATSAASKHQLTLTTTDMEAKLISISLVGIALLGLIGAILAFNGPVTLLLFLTLGIMALITGVTAVFGLFVRLLRWIIMILYSLLHLGLNALLGMMATVARPFVRMFNIHGTDISNDGDNTEELSSQAEELPPREPPRIVETPPPNDPQTPPQHEPPPPEVEPPNFKPSDTEWNPL
jgi:hypothetical protein